MSQGEFIMKKAMYILLVLLGVMFFLGTDVLAQRPVRGSVFPQKKATDTPAEDVSSKSTASRRFGDTIAVGSTQSKATTPQAQPTVSANIAEEVEKATALFNNQKYVEASDRFTQLAGTIKNDDPLLYEVQFMQGECASVLGQLERAEKILTMLSSKPNIPPGVMERTLVRLGHVFCGLGKTDQATKAFSKFKKEFPASQYNSVANCESVK